MQRATRLLVAAMVIGSDGDRPPIFYLCVGALMIQFKQKNYYCY